MKIAATSKIAVLLILLITGSLRLDAQEKIIKDETNQDGLTLSKTVCLKTENICNHVKYSYQYDNQDRITLKKVSKWDEDSESWVPFSQSMYSYLPGKKVIEYSRWDLENQYYFRKGKSEYIYDEANTPVNCLVYKWNDWGNKWKQTAKIDYVDTAQNKLTAQSR